MDARRPATVFNQIAGDYDRHRPGYPDVLVDRACEVAGVGPGAPVLEVGCGTGQLTRSLLARGLSVTAVEPGDQLIALARAELGANAAVEFVNARLEDARLPRRHYRAAFSAAAIHWVDADVGWRRLAGALTEGGTLALLSYFGLDDPRSAPDQAALRAELARAAPVAAAAWPAYRDLETTLAGVEARLGNVSEAWSWLGGYDLGRPSAARLFHDVLIATVPVQREDSAEAINALLRTMSFWAGLTTLERDAVAEGNLALERRLGRPIRSSLLACLVTARRAG